ncbi:SDR family NAD(P)-dependent oxidoreductase [Amycolatopsis nalaikhensis]|uniref:SDR family oxidoreductase n=1 Tax=Amycolatopsis nalaikhensis TaxID=715472 RepID=A0ABY8XGQ4_9PSEU|nr:SDR family oxidoreductase [Amycolatopsis sp. 2-2]WIV54781.1 SDR family oxidoreductase [Amycolatopsis sp. 2-2]
MPHDFSGRTALVTGATSGIGRATAVALAERGAAVVVHGRDPRRAAETVALIEEKGGTARFEAADLADPAEVTRLAARAGSVDVLVNNAGIFRFASTADTDQATFGAHLDVNLRAPFLLVQALAPAMVARGRGAVVNLSSGAAATPGFGTGVYGASKAALESLTRVWAAEFGPAGVRVNAVAAGPTRTEGTAVHGEAFEAAAQSVALRRLADADEIAEAVVFLASDAAGYVNGATLSAMGGLPALG